MDATDWISIATQVAQIAANVLPLILGGKQNLTEEEYYYTGDVWWLPYEAGTYAGVASAPGATKCGISFASFDHKVSEYFEIEPGNYVAVTDEMSRFRDGQVCIARVVTTPATAHSPEMMRAIAFSMKTLALSTAVSIVGDLKVYVKKEVDTFSVGFESNSVQSMEVTASATDTRGGTVTASGKFNKPPAGSPGSEWLIPLPAGVDLDPIVAQLDLSLNVDSGFYSELRKTRTKVQMPGRPGLAKAA